METVDEALQREENEKEAKIFEFQQNLEKEIDEAYEAETKRIGPILKSDFGIGYRKAISNHLNNIYL